MDNTGVGAAAPSYGLSDDCEPSYAIRQTDVTMCTPYILVTSRHSTI